MKFFFSPFAKLILRVLVFFCHILQVTYMYYTGRLEVFNENFPAVSKLSSFSVIDTFFIRQISKV